MTEMTEALYLYAFAKTDRARELKSEGVQGTGGVFFEQCGDISAALSRVPLDDFVGEDAETHLQDLAWVGPRAVTHQRVIEEIMTHSPVFPAGFGTLFFSVEGVRRTVSANLDVIRDFLNRMDDKEEWSVKGLLARNRLMERLYAQRLAENEKEFSALAQGVRYFRERRLRAQVEKEVGAFLKTIVSQVADGLTELACERKRRSISARPKDESGRELIFNWAFLVERSRVEDFVGSVDRIAEETEASGLSLDASGPWPPYSFSPQLAMEDDS